MKISCSFILALIILLASCKGSTSTAPAPARAWVVSTLAGSGTAGYQDGAAATALFDFPAGVAVDKSGNVYVAERNNHCIRKIAKDGGAWTVSTFAGDGTEGDQNGAAADAQFRYPSGVAVDSSGNVYVSEFGNHRIRKITKDGGAWTVSTLAGGTIAGSKSGDQNGVGTAAQFNGPQGVAVDKSGNVYVADSNNHRIRKITPGGTVSTFAGSTSGYQDGAAATALFRAPYGVAVDESGNVYVADSGNHRIRKITETEEVDADGNKIWTVSTPAGSGTRTTGHQDGVGTAVRFNRPTGVAVDKSGNVYVADYTNQRIRKIVITPGEGQEEDTVEVSTIAGSTQDYRDGVGTAARFNHPNGVAVDSSGSVYVADQGNHRIRKIEYRVP